MTSRTLLIDGDILVYKGAYLGQEETDWDGDGNTTITSNYDYATQWVDQEIETYIETLNAEAVMVALSDRSQNFRKQIDAGYKAKRPKTKPILYAALRNHLAKAWKAQKADWLEGDDLLAIMATNGQFEDPVIISTDKDFKQVPCQLSKNGADIQKRSQYQADCFFMQQVLQGDSTDNYPGCPGIGEKRARALILEAVGTDRKSPVIPRVWPQVVEMYRAKGLTEDDAIRQARLAYILRDGDYCLETGAIRLWTPPED